MASSPYSGKGTLVTVVIKVDGSPIKDTYELSSISTVKEINRISTAKVVLFDGSTAKETFEISESNDFKPGAEIEIMAGYNSDENTIYKGVIVTHSIQVKKSSSYLTLKCYDPAVAMTIHKHSKYFLKSKDSDAINEICGDYKIKKSIASTPEKHKELIQYYSTDWDFILSRAEVNGMVVLVDDGKLTVEKPKMKGSAKHSVMYGTDIRRFHGEMDARTQLSSVKCSAWDIADLKVVKGETSKADENKQGNIDGKALSKLFNSKPFEMQSTAPLSEKMLKTWAEAQMVKSRLARIRGFVAIKGTEKVELGGLLKLEGVGKRFNGDAYLSKIVHEIKGGDWETIAHFGVDDSWFAERVEVTAPVTNGLLPGIHGIQNGVVKKIDEDPDGNHRIQVDIPMIKESGDGVWARMSHMYASKEYGSFFLPAVGDEVVLGFFNDDPRYPVILGMMYSKKLKPAYKAEKENPTLGWVTKNKLKITFEDKDKNIIIETPGKNIITLSDKDKKVTIVDQNKNKIEMTDKGISFDTPKDFIIKSKGEIKLEALKTITLKATQDVKIEGLNIANKAKVGFKAEGQATAELKASGQTVVKGAIVMIN